LTHPDGTMRVAGICSRKMNDGASESDVFAVEPGAERGTWKQVRARVRSLEKTPVGGSP